MKIKQINIRKYGPLSDFNYNCNDKVNLFFGNNESGKTSFVDFLINYLFSSRKKIFEGSKRFMDDKNGSLKLEMAGREYVLPSDDVKIKELLKLPDIELSRLFIVRAGDLNLNTGGSSNWWSSVRQLLTNVNTDLSKIKKDIYKNVGLTSTGEWSGARTLGNLKQEVEDAEIRLEELKGAKNKLKQVSNEERLIKKKSKEFKEVKQELDKLKKTKQYLKYKKSKETFEKFNTNKEKLKDYDRYKINYLTKWKELRDDFYKLKVEKDNYDKNFQDKIKLRKKLKSDIEKTESRLEQLKKINTLIQERKINCMLDFFLVKKFLLSSAFRNFTYIVLISVFGLSLFLSIILTNGLLWFFPAVFFSVLISIYFIKRKIDKNINMVNSSIERIPYNSKFSEVTAKNINNIKDGIIELKSDKKNYNESITSVNSDIDSIKIELNEISNRINQKQDNLEELRNITGLAEYKDLENKIDCKRQLKNEKDKAEARLNDIFNEADFTKWESLIKQLKVSFSDEKTDYSLEREKEIEGKKSILKEEIDKLEKEVDLFYNRLKDRFDIEEIPQIYSEITELNKQVEKFYIDKEAAVLSRELIDEFKQTFDSQLKNIFEEKNGIVNHYFKKFTDDRYASVKFSDEDFIVSDANGNNCKLFDLSTGTQDQLMLAVRIAFLIKGFNEPSFMILDDAFLTSDYNRRQQLVLVMKELIEDGWQIFYLTIDEHVRDLFVKECDADIHMLKDF